MLVITIALSSAGLGIYFVTISYDASYDTAYLSVMSGFGEIIILDPKQPSLFENNMYYDNVLSFQLLKPDSLWQIRSASEDMNAQTLTSLKSKGYLDGIYLEKQHGEQFMVSVFDVQSENFQLKDYVANQITLIDINEDVKIPIKAVSQSNDWAIFSVDMKTIAGDIYAEQLLFLKDNRLYMLQYSGKSPESLTESEKSDFNSILDSFEVL